MATSVSQIVEQIIESLGESISQLMMLVIVLQERNADPPPQLPSGVNVVTGSAETLQQVAQSLAEAEYSEYPDIKAQILEASAEVGASVALLKSAMHHLGTSPDRAGSWDTLVKACKTMSAKTIQLLQIVYGAERERVFRAAQRALDALRNVNPDMAASDPKNFAAQVSEAATKAAQLAAYVRGKAEETDSAEQKAALTEKANELTQHSQILIQDANDLLKTPNDPALKDKVSGDLDDLRTTIDATTRLLHNMDHEFDDAHDRFLDSSADIERSLAELAAGGLDSYDEDILLTGKRELQGMDNLLDDLDRGDAAAAREALAYAAGQNQKLAKLAEMEAKILPAGEVAKKQDLLKCQRALEEIFPAYENAANRAILNPDDDNAQDSLDEAHDRLDAAIQALANLVTNPNAEIGAAARKEVEDLAKMRDAAASANANGVSRAARAVVKENKVLTDVCTEQAGKCEDDSERNRMILDNVDELQRLLPHQILAAKKALEDPSAASLQQLDDSTNTMTEQVKATAEVSKTYPELELLSAAEKEKNLLTDIRSSAESGNGQQVALLAPQLASNTALIGSLARDIARGKGRVRQARILESVVALEKLQAPTAKEAEAVARDPSSQQAKARLQQKTAQMAALVDKIVAECDAELFRQVLLERGDLHNMKNSVDVGDPTGLADSTKAVVKDQATLIPLARAAAHREENPTRKKQMESDIAELERLLPNTVAQTNRVLAAPGDDKAKETLRQSIDTTRALLLGISDPNEYNASLARGAAADGVDPEAARLKSMMPALMAAAERAARNPHDRMAQQALQDLLDALPLDALDSDQEKLARMLREADDALTRMTEAAERGDPTATRAAAGDVQAIVDKAKKQACKIVAESNDEDAKARVHGACRALDRLLPEAFQSSLGVANSPGDELAKRRMYENVAEVRGQLAILGHAACGTVETRLRDAARKEKEALARLRKAVQTGDVAGARQAIVDVKRENAKLCEEGRTAAGGVRDPTLNKRILDTVTSLEKLMPVLDSDCMEGASSPDDAAKQTKAMGDIQRCENLIDQLLTDTRADAVGLAQLENSILTEMEAHLKNRDPQAAADVKKLIATQQELKAAATREMNKMSNPRAKQNIQSALDELDRLLPVHINKGKAVLQKGDEASKRELADSTRAMRAPLAQIVATIKPNPANVAEATRNREAALLAALRQACARGDKNEAERLLPEVAAMNDRLVKLAANEANNPKRPAEARETLKKASKELADLHAGLAPLARAAAANPADLQAQARLANHTSRMEAAMDQIVKALRHEDSRSDKARRLVNALMRQSKSGNIDSASFLSAAKSLADYIDSLVTGDASLDEQLALLAKQSRAAQPMRRQMVDSSIDGMLGDIKSFKPKPKAAPVAVKPKVKKPEPKTFDERIQRVAEDITEATDGADSNDPVIRLTRKIAAELSRMAAAAKSGKRQEMVQASRDATATINELCNSHLKDLSHRCKDKRTGDKMGRAAQAMKNYSVQMKILAAVKAGSGSDTDADTEDQLVSVTRSVGKCITESVASVTTMRNAHLLG